jgi:hypothetical protein
MTDRAQALYLRANAELEKAGIEAGAEGEALTRIIAVILDGLFPPPKRKRAASAPIAGAITPKGLFDALEASCAHIIQLRPYSPGSFGRLGKELAACRDIEPTDLERLVAWINGGGLSTWPTKVTWGHVCKHWLSWIAQARAWEAKSGGAPTTTDDWR